MANLSSANTLERLEPHLGSAADTTPTPTSSTHPTPQPTPSTKAKAASLMPNRIKDMRMKRGMSLSELSELTGMTRSELHKLEKGVRRIRTDHLPPLAKALKCGPEELLNAELAEQLLGDRQRYSGTVDAASGQGPSMMADLPIYGITDINGQLRIDENEPQAYVMRSPQLHNVKTSYALYMPDESMEPALPKGALLYVNPILPTRVGDLVVAIWPDGVSRVLQLTQSTSPDSGTRLVLKDTQGTEILPQDHQGLRLQRVIGLSFI